MARLVDWFIDNPIAANLLMLLIIIGGVVGGFNLDKEFFPEQKVNEITVSVAYPGAGPAEVESQIILRIEEMVADLNGIEELRSTAAEGSALVSIEVEDGYDSQRLLNDVKSRVDSITTFPVEVERPIVTETLWRSQLLSVVLAGDIGEASLKELGQRIRDELAALPGVSQVDLNTPRDDEVIIELSEEAMQRYGLQFDQVAAAIRASSLNLPAGKIETKSGDIQLQTRGQSYTGVQFDDIVVLKAVDGTKVLLRDIATVIDGFSETKVLREFNGKPSLSLEVYLSSHPDVLESSDRVHEYVDQLQGQLPPSVEAVIWFDFADLYRDRVHTLLSNGLGGLVLVFVLLMLFLRPLLAFWVCSGIAVAFLGAVAFLPVTGTSLNMVSLFAFILILGILVDDAIIVGESIYSQHTGGVSGYEAAKTGSRLVLMPVLFAVISTIIFFVPMYFLGAQQAAAAAIPDVVLVALSFSLLESLLILPSHLMHLKPEATVDRNSPLLLQGLHWLRQRFSRGMSYAGDQVYRPLLVFSIQWRRLVVVGFVFVFFVSVAMIMGGWIGNRFFPRVHVDLVSATAHYAEGVSFEQVNTGRDRMQRAASKVQAEFNRRYNSEVVGDIESLAYGTTAMVRVQLAKADKRLISAEQLKQALEKEIGELPNTEAFELLYTISSLGKPVTLELIAPDLKTLTAVSAQLREELATFPGVYNIKDSLQNPRTEIELQLKPQAQSLNLSLSNLARQVRQGFYGEEVQRIPRIREDVRVMLRYPEAQRKDQLQLFDMRVRTDTGVEVPFDTVADIHYTPGYSKIERKDRKRIAMVTADLSPGQSSLAHILQTLNRDSVPGWQQQYPGLEIKVEGEEKERSEFVVALGQMMVLAMLSIYGLMAIAFRSYWQPVLVLSAIPFGFVGAVLGHMIMGLEISMFSMLGVIAAAGVVVNDNLVLISHINRLREMGLDLNDALLRGGQERFRPIILTSMTTFIGLLPIMSESSVQAQFLIPMVVSLAFGVLLATFVTLIFVPLLYLGGERVKERTARRWGKGASTTAHLSETDQL